MARQKREISRRSIIRGAIIAALTLVVGVAAVRHSIASIAADRVPDVALKFAPDHPVALANKADLEFRLGRPEEATRLAQAAVRATALSSEAFEVLGLVRSIGSSRRGATSLLEYSSRLSRREVPVQVWLFQQGLIDGDVGTALRRLDGAMRVSELSRPSLYPILAGAMATDDLIGHVRELFAEEPVWLPGFLIFAVRNQAALPNMARIVTALPEESQARTVDMQSMLLGGLVTAGEYSSARAFMRAIAPASDDHFVRDPSFEINGPYVPFDWDYTAGVTLGTSPRGKDTGGVRYHADTGRGGLVAAQLLALEPGSYRLISKGRVLSLHRDGGAAWSVECAGDEAPELAQLPMQRISGGNAATASKIFTVPSSQCGAQWLRLNLQATFSPGGVEGTVDNIQIRSTAQD